MHLKSTNGPIDVLVCPEGEDDQRSQSPFSQDDDDNDYNPAIPSLIQPELEELTPTNTPPPPSSASSQQMLHHYHHHNHQHHQQQGHQHPLTPHTPVHSNQCMPPGSCGSPLPNIHMTPQSHHRHPPHHMAMASPADCNSSTTPAGGSVVPQVIDPSSMMDCTPGPASELDISLSSTADVNADDLEGLMDSYHCDSLDNIDSSALLSTHDMGMLGFESLSPPLQHEDFCFAMEASEGIQDLFDLVA